MDLYQHPRSSCARHDRNCTCLRHRAREQDLRRARNLQAKLARAQDGAQSQPKALSHAFAPQPQEYESPSSRAGLMFMSSIEQARREREQRTGERHLKRQVAGPMPPESWRDDFDRLSIRRGNASHLNRQRLQALMSSTTAPLSDQDWRERTDSQPADAAHTMTPTAAVRAKQRAKQRATCAGLRRFYDSSDPFHESRPLLSLCDMALCVIADSLNRPPSTGDKGTRGKARDETSEIDHLQKAEVLEYLPAHMRQRMMALCGRLAFTKQPLCDSVAQALTHADITEALEIDQSGLKDQDGAEDDWEASAISYEDLGSTLSAKRGDAFSSLDLSFSSIAKYTMHRMFFTMHGGQMFSHSACSAWLAGTTLFRTRKTNPIQSTHPWNRSCQPLRDFSISRRSTLRVPESPGQTFRGMPSARNQKQLPLSFAN
ncbi:hypothetical protein NDA13_000883 [Ustilago tritici]|nr:hypothetical protein NDA13_000883 [Ustilago tritici]